MFMHQADVGEFVQVYLSLSTFSKHTLRRLPKEYETVEIRVYIYVAK